MKVVKNISHSIKEKLLKISRDNKINFDTLLLRYLQERILFRLHNSMYDKLFILKGGLFLFAANSLLARPTKDIDFLGKNISNDFKVVVDAFKEICLIESNDGVVFDCTSVMAEHIKEDADYEGVRLSFDGFLGKAKKRMQIDIGFGDVVYPEVEEMIYPSLLDSSFNVYAYSKVSVIAEKFEAMSVLSYANSRMKDFYDIHWLLEHNDFDGNELFNAISQTFRQRGTRIDGYKVIFEEDFYKNDDKKTQWIAFLNRLDKTDVTFEEVILDIMKFLKPVCVAIEENEIFIGRWSCKNLEWLRKI